MKCMLLLSTILGYMTVSKSSLDELPVHPGVGGLYKGPNSETIIKGPDGSVITAQQEGGSVVTQDLSVQPVISTVSPPVALETPIIASNPVAADTSPDPVVAVAPVAAVIPLKAAAPVTAIVPAVPVGHTVEIILPDPHIIETELVDAPVIEPQQLSDLVGPSGSISTRGSSSIISGPASTTISEPAKVVVATPLVAAVPVISTVTMPLREVPLISDSISSSISSATERSGATSPGIRLSSAVSPVLGSTAAPPTNTASSTVTSRVWELNSGLSSSTPSSNIGALIEPASTYGVVNTPGAAVQVPSTVRPEITRTSTITPLVQSNQDVGLAIDLDLLNNKQLNINPSLIPPANIIPPEIGPNCLPQTIDQEVDEISSQLWNRYERDLREQSKYKTTDIKG